MTTAHRATWRTARGGDNEEGSFRLHVGTAQRSAKAAPGHHVLKERTDAGPAADRAALRAALEAREKGEAPDTGAGDEITPVLAEGGEAGGDNDSALPDDSDAGAMPPPPKRPRLRGAATGDAGGRPLPAVSGAEGADSGESESESDDDDDDDAELLAELEKIRAERAAGRERRAAAERAKLEAQEEARAAGGNPLLGNVADDDSASVATSATSFAVRRRWNDDVVFKDKARGERRPEQRFVNDTIRNDFHRKFLDRYMR